MPTVLWWGRSDSDYSRNRIVSRQFVELGWRVLYFSPMASWLGRYEAYLRRLQRPDLIWVPCFRHKDIMAASHWADKWNVPLVIDPLISAFEKEVYEKNKYPPGSSAAEKIKNWEMQCFAKADIIIADTPSHSKFFQKELGISAKKIEVFYVGAETQIFQPAPVPPLQPPFEILFYGSFLKLQGAEVIVRAAATIQDLPVIWTLLGEGEYKPVCQRLARMLKNVRFEPWTDYDHLPNRIARAHIVLGIFGSSVKADLVIPNKVFQAMAMARPIITRRSSAYENTIENSNVIGWVSPQDPLGLAFIVRKWFEDPSKLKVRAKETGILFDRFFGEHRQRAVLEHIVQKALVCRKG
ncbi:MAG: glycosyltransferase [Deltaproteobacteria bacterium]|nr:glycosyltransferase [Deltaproteobacteria bacterium]